MPEFVNSSVWSPAGTRLALGTIVWPRSAKNSRNRARISAPVRYGIEVSEAGVAIAAMVPKRPVPPDARTGAGRRPRCLVRNPGRLRPHGLPAAVAKRVQPVGRVELPRGRHVDLDERTEARAFELAERL